jgi:Na+/H+ antiporter NhaC
VHTPFCWQAQSFPAQSSAITRPDLDTTIASATTQTYTRKEGVADIAGVVSSRMKYALVAAGAATILFAVFGGSNSVINSAEAQAILVQYSDPKGLIMLIPVVILLVIAFVKRNIYIACTWGIISGIVIGLVSGILIPADIMSIEGGSLSGFLMDGITTDRHRRLPACNRGHHGVSLWQRPDG